MRLILVRHGETYANRTGITNGQFEESDLTAMGQEQARHAAERLRSEPFRAAYSSDQLRARHTAAFILQHHPHLRLELRPELRERHYGVLEGQRFSAFDEALAASGKSRHEFQPQGGEHYSDVRSRVARFHAELLRRHSEDTVLIVSHSGTLGVYILEILKEPNESIVHYRNHPYTAVTIVEYDLGGVPQLARLKDDSHLPPELRRVA